MKIAVYGPARRVAILVDGNVLDLRNSCALYLQNVENEPNPYQMADAIVGDSLSKFLNYGDKVCQSQARQPSSCENRRT